MEATKESKYTPCARCGKGDKPTYFVHSASQLIFGGFRPNRMEYRCSSCERKVSKNLSRMLNTNMGTKDEANRLLDLHYDIKNEEQAIQVLRKIPDQIKDLQKKYEHIHRILRENGKSVKGLPHFI